jgi:hypothetical protein
VDTHGNLYATTMMGIQVCVQLVAVALRATIHRWDSGGYRCERRGFSDRRPEVDGYRLNASEPAAGFFIAPACGAIKALVKRARWRRVRRQTPTFGSDLV